jgi:hypothetical protein
LSVRGEGTRAGVGKGRDGEDDLGDEPGGGVEQKGQMGRDVQVDPVRAWL